MVYSPGPALIRKLIIFFSKPFLAFLPPTYKSCSFYWQFLLAWCSIIDNSLTGTRQQNRVECYCVTRSSQWCSWGDSGCHEVSTPLRAPRQRHREAPSYVERSVGSVRSSKALIDVVDPTCLILNNEVFIVDGEKSAPGRSVQCCGLPGHPRLTPPTRARASR